jgi:hypothetical protein
MYVVELPHEMREAALRTKHKWNIKVSDAEAEKIATVSDDVDFKTRHATEVQHLCLIPPSPSCACSGFLDPHEDGKSSTVFPHLRRLRSTDST